jgi:hypothetical protein
MHAVKDGNAVGLDSGLDSTLDDADDVRGFVALIADGTDGNFGAGFFGCPKLFRFAWVR